MSVSDAIRGSRGGQMTRPKLWPIPTGSASTSRLAGTFRSDSFGFNAFCLVLSVGPNGRADRAEDAELVVRSILQDCDSGGTARPVLVVYAPGLERESVINLADAGATVISRVVTPGDLQDEASPSARLFRGLLNDPEAAGAQDVIAAFYDPALSPSGVTSTAARPTDRFVLGDAVRPGVDPAYSNLTAPLTGDSRLNNAGWLIDV